MNTSTQNTKNLRKQFFFILIILVTQVSCKERLNECGEPVDEVCGGIGCGPSDARLYFLVTSPNIANETLLTEAKKVRVYNADDTDMGGWLTTKFVPGFECDNSPFAGAYGSSGYVTFSVPPGETLNWVAKTNDNTKTWSGNYYNLDCRDEENCRVIELNVD